MPIEFIYILGTKWHDKWHGHILFANKKWHSCGEKKMKHAIRNPKFLISLQSQVFFKFLNSWIPATQANSHQLRLWVFSVFLLSHQVDFSFSFSFYYQTKNLKKLTLTAFVQLSKQQGMQYIFMSSISKHQTEPREWEKKIRPE